MTLQRNQWTSQHCSLQLHHAAATCFRFLWLNVFLAHLVLDGFTESDPIWMPHLCIIHQEYQCFGDRKWWNYVELIFIFSVLSLSSPKTTWCWNNFQLKRSTYLTLTWVRSNIKQIMNPDSTLMPQKDALDRIPTNQPSEVNPIQGPSKSNCQ